MLLSGEMCVRVLITGIKKFVLKCVNRNYFATNLLTIHTEGVSVQDNFSLC